MANPFLEDKLFQIDGIDMPIPSSVLVNPKPLSSNAERVAGTGEAVVPFLRMTYEVTWTYAWLEFDDYYKLYKQYIEVTAENESMYHTLTTFDSNTKKNLTINIYTQGDFTAPIDHVYEGVPVYTNVVFTFVGR